MRRSLIQMVGFRVYVLMFWHACWHNFKKGVIEAGLVMTVIQGFGCPDEFYEEASKAIQAPDGTVQPAVEQQDRWTPGPDEY
jgi:hypothetical protein